MFVPSFFFLSKFFVKDISTTVKDRNFIFGIQVYNDKLYCGFDNGLSEDNQSGVIEAFNSISRYLDDLLNIDNNFFDSMVNRIYPSELQLNKANVSDAEAPFLDLHLSISDGFVKTKIYDKRDDFDFDFDIVNFPFFSRW